MSEPSPSSTTLNASQFLELPLDSIKIPPRFRSEVTDVADLVDSFSQLGQLQPILVDDSLTLIAGFRRIQAARRLGWPTIKACIANDVPTVVRKVAEYEENVRRADFRWQERCLALCEIHEMKKKSDPKWGYRETAALLGLGGLATISAAVRVAEALRAGDEEISSAPSIREAVNILVQRRMREVTNRLIETISKAPSKGGSGKTIKSVVNDTTVHLNLDIRHCDCLELVAATKPRCIFTDPPYGIALAEWDDFKLDTSLIRDTHHPDDNLLLLQKFITDSFSLCSEPAWMFLWCDFEVWPLLKEFGEKAGWRVQRWPLVWIKPNHRSNQTPFSNFTKSTEAGILMAKGSATLTNPAPPNWVMLDNTKPSDITNPFYKPKEAHMAFLRHLAPIGSTVVDPFCGSGSIAEAAIALGVNYIGGDIDPVHVANARSRLKLT